MNLMKSLSLIISLILTVGYLTPVQAVTDAELEALEKQIEQQEAEEKRQAEAKLEKQQLLEEKRLLEKQVEEMRKLEAEKKQLAEQKRLEEEEEKKMEEARLAELERQRQEEEAKKRAEEEKKEKYTLLITEAEQAVSNKDKELAISKYNEALTIYPNDTIANTGIKEAEKLKHKVCFDVLGVWYSDGKPSYDLKEDGIYLAFYKTRYDPYWECIDPVNRTIKIKAHKANMELTAVLSDDGQCMIYSNSSVAHRPGHICEVAQPKETVKQNPLGL